MKKILTISILSAGLLMSASPIHDAMDSKLKGKSFGGTLDDHEAASDGLGIIPLNGYSPSRDEANELIEYKVLNKLLKSETDKTKTSNVRNSITAGTLGTEKDINILSNIGIELAPPSTYPGVDYKYDLSQNCIVEIGKTSCMDRITFIRMGEKDGTKIYTPEFEIEGVPGWRYRSDEVTFDRNLINKLRSYQSPVDSSYLIMTWNGGASSLQASVDSPFGNWSWSFSSLARNIQNCKTSEVCLNGLKSRISEGGYTPTF